MLESTNNWSMKNYRAILWYPTPFSVLAVPFEPDEDQYMYRITFDLYNGNSYRTSRLYLETRDVFESEDQTIHDTKLVEESNAAKNDWLVAEDMRLQNG